MNKEELDAYHSAMWNLAKSIADSNMEPVQRYVDIKAPLINGEHDARLTLTGTVREMNLMKLDTGFFRNMGLEVLKIQKLFAEYQIARQKLISTEH